MSYFPQEDEVEKEADKLTEEEREEKGKETELVINLCVSIFSFCRGAGAVLLARRRRNGEYRGEDEM